MGVQSLDQVEAGRLVDGQDTVGRLPCSVDLLPTGSASSSSRRAAGGPALLPTGSRVWAGHAAQESVPNRTTPCAPQDGQAHHV